MPGITGHEKPYEGNTNVWLTPKSLIDKLGPFDLDPCAANPRPFDIGTFNFTEFEDGLRLPWVHDEHGSLFVFMNPPYGPTVGRWLDKLAAHRNGLALVFARTETIAMQRALRQTDAVFFPSKRITFLQAYPPHLPGKGSSGAPSMFLAFGNEAVSRLQRFSIPEDGLLFYPGEIKARKSSQTTLF